MLIQGFYVNCEMRLAESLSTEQVIVSSLRHNDLIELHLETPQTKKKTKKHSAEVLCSPCSFINQAGRRAEIVCRSMH